MKGTTRARNEDTRTESKKKKAGRQILGTRKEKIEVATWNVRSTYMEGKLIRLSQIMEKYKIELLANSNPGNKTNRNFYKRNI
jgi:hypothetical protein